MSEREELKAAYAAISAVEPIEPSKRFWVLLFACNMVGRQALEAQLTVPGGFTEERDRQARSLRLMATAIESVDLDAEVERCARQGHVTGFREWLDSEMRKLDADPYEE